MQEENYVLNSFDEAESEAEGRLIMEEATERYLEFCDNIAKQLNTTLSVFTALPEGGIDELQIKGFVLKLYSYCSPTQFDVLKDGKRVALLRMRGGRVACYFGDSEDYATSEKIYEKNYHNESWNINMVGDFFTDKDLEESIRLINERLAA